MFSLFQPILCKAQIWLCGKIPEGQQLLKSSELSCHQQPNITFLPRADAQCEIRQVVLTVSKRVAAMRVTDRTFALECSLTGVLKRRNLEPDICYEQLKFCRNSELPN